MWFGKCPSGSRNWLPEVSREEAARAVARIDDDVHPLERTFCAAERVADFLREVFAVAPDEVEL